MVGKLLLVCVVFIEFVYVGTNILGWLIAPGSSSDGDREGEETESELESVAESEISVVDSSCPPYSLSNRRLLAEVKKAIKLNSHLSRQRQDALTQPLQTSSYEAASVHIASMRGWNRMVEQCEQLAPRRAVLQEDESMSVAVAIPEWTGGSHLSNQLNKSGDISATPLRQAAEKEAKSHRKRDPNRILNVLPPSMQTRQQVQHEQQRRLAQGMPPWDVRPGPPLPGRWTSYANHFTPHTPSLAALHRAGRKDPSLCWVEDRSHRESCEICHQKRRGYLLLCRVCDRPVHPSCVEMRGLTLQRVLLFGWECLVCRGCEVCSAATDERNMLFCEDCDRGYHTFCLDPILTSIPNGPWRCQSCRHCYHCGSTDGGFKWHSGYTMCNPCKGRFFRNNYCPQCLRSYTDVAETPMIKCTECRLFVHHICDRTLDEKTIQFHRMQGEESRYKCPACRGEALLYELEEVLRCEKVPHEPTIL